MNEALVEYARLLEQFLSGAVPAEEFQRAYLGRFKNEQRSLEEPLFEVLDELFGAVDAYTGDPLLLAEQPAFYLTEDGLRAQVVRAAGRLSALRGAEHGLPAAANAHVVRQTGDDASTWARLLLKQEPALRPRLALLAEDLAAMDDWPPPFHPGDGLGGSVQTLAEALLFLGPAACQDGFALLVPTLPRATRDMDPARPGRVPTTQGLLGFVMVAQNAGALPEGALQAEMARWAERLAHRQPPADLDARTSCGLLTAALAIDTPARQLCGVSLPAFQAGQRFDNDMARLTCYLLDAIAAQAPLAAVEPAWQGFLRNFPRLLAAGAANWVTPHAVARLVWARVGGMPVGTMAAHTHRQVMLAIAG
ncbi:hypothetical protein BurJ1DRAFT_2324 [Burkholderiales bacterium JOSHI_001]|nr:hypothetical protein BurJ1DRAFT_2324 [Burkholderiales bacterium JOSHI_001]